MKKITFTLLAALLLLTGCASTDYANYYPNGQVREEYADRRIGCTDLLLGALLVPFIFLCAFSGPGPHHHGHHHGW